MRHVVIAMLAALPSVAIAASATDRNMPVTPDVLTPNGFYNPATGVRGYAYVDRAADAGSPRPMPLQDASVLPKPVLCKPTGPDLRIQCFDPVTPAAASSRKP